MCSLCAEFYSSQSNTVNFSSTFTDNYNNLHCIAPSAQIDPKAKYLEMDISINEISSCLSCSTGSTPGFDKISYQMINNSVQLKTRILTLYDKILKTGIIPQKFKTALIIPIKNLKTSRQN